MTGGTVSPTAGARRVGAARGQASFASDEGGESAGCLSECNQKPHYDGRHRFADCRSSQGGCGRRARGPSRATKEANLAGCLSECNQKPHYDGRHRFADCRSSQGGYGEGPGVGRERRRRRIWRAACQSAIRSCDEIENLKSAFRYRHRDLGLAHLSHRAVPAAPHINRHPCHQPLVIMTASS